MASSDENCERLPPLHLDSVTVDDLARDDDPPGARSALTVTLSVTLGMAQIDDAATS
jgi:hypothetical protein